MNTMKKPTISVILIFVGMTMLLMFIGAGCDDTGDPPCSTMPWGYKEVDLINVYCTYGDISKFQFHFTVVNRNKKDMEISYNWTLNDPKADRPVYQGSGHLSLSGSKKVSVLTNIEKTVEYDPRFYVMHVSVFRYQSQIGHYQEQKSAFDWDYSVTPPVRLDKP